MEERRQRHAKAPGRLELRKPTLRVPPPGPVSAPTSSVYQIRPLRSLRPPLWSGARSRRHAARRGGTPRGVRGAHTSMALRAIFVKPSHGTVRPPSPLSGGPPLHAAGVDGVRVSQSRRRTLVGASGALRLGGGLFLGLGCAWRRHGRPVLVQRRERVGLAVDAAWRAHGAEHWGQRARTRAGGWGREPSWAVRADPALILSHWRTPHAPERAPTRPAAAPGAPTLRTMAPPTPTRGEVVAVAPQRAAVAGALGSWAGHSAVSLACHQSLSTK